MSASPPNFSTHLCLPCQDKGVFVRACSCVRARAPLPSGRGVGLGGVEVDQALPFVGGGLEEPHVEEPHPALPW
jgi:hypothetical protein